MLSIGNWTGFSNHKFRLQTKTPPLPKPPASAIKSYRKEAQKRIQSEEEFNEIWRIKVKFLQDQNQKLKHRKTTKNYYSYLLFKKPQHIKTWN